MAYLGSLIVCASGVDRNFPIRQGIRGSSSNALLQLPPSPATTTPKASVAYAHIFSPFLNNSKQCPRTLPSPSARPPRRLRRLPAPLPRNQRRKRIPTSPRGPCRRTCSLARTGARGSRLKTQKLALVRSASSSEPSGRSSTTRRRSPTSNSPTRTRHAPRLRRLPTTRASRRQLPPRPLHRALARRMRTRSRLLVVVSIVL